MEDVHRYRIRHSLPEQQIEMMSQIDVLKHQREIIGNWKPWTDVWSLEYGCGILAGAAALTGLYINRRFRIKLKLRSYGHLPTILGLSVSPAATAYLMHRELILNKLLTYDVSCTLCLESKSVVLQIFGGLLMGLVAAPFANFSVAAGSGLYSVPLRNDYRGMFRVTLSVYRPLLPNLALAFTVHALLAAFLTRSHIKSFIHMEQIQHLIEQDRTKKLKIQDDF